MRTVANIGILTLLMLMIIGVCYLQKSPKECFIDPMLEKLRKDIIKIEPKADKLQYFTSDESYTEDKSKVFICLKNEKGEYYPYNELIQVVVHELGHAFSPVIDPNHVSIEFNSLHEYYRKKAQELGLFDPSKPVSSTYCPKKK